MLDEIRLINNMFYKREKNATLSEQFQNTTLSEQFQFQYTTLSEQFQ
jgi:hypothetical protein